MSKKYNVAAIIDDSFDELCHNSIELVEYARQIVAKQINLVQLMTFYSIGRWIVEVQQQGESRARYGSQVIKKLSEEMTKKFGKGFSEDTLKNARKLYWWDIVAMTGFTT